MMVSAKRSAVAVVADVAMVRLVQVSSTTVPSRTCRLNSDASPLLAA